MSAMTGDISINAVDVLLGLVIALGVWSGWVRGFIRGVLELSMLAAGLVAAFWGYQALAEILAQYIAALGAWAGAAGRRTGAADAELVTGAAAGWFVSIMLLATPPDLRRARSAPCQICAVIV